MRALVISDIHANLPAFEAVLDAAPQYDVVWNLGDIVGCGANPNQVIDVSKNLGGILVRGNHDRICSGNIRFGEYRDLSRLALYAANWTEKALSRENAKWLSRLSRGPLRPLGRKVACVHGSPNSEDEYIIYDWSAYSALNANRAWITFFGHTHLQGGWVKKQRNVTAVKPQFHSSSEAECFEFQLSKKCRYILNPGSVGQPRDGDWRAAFAIYDDLQSQLTWHRTPYNVLAAQKRIRRAGLPDFLADRLRMGR